LLSEQTDVSTIDVKPALKNLMQLYANMLTPASSARSSLQPWMWIHNTLYPNVLKPILDLTDHADLTSIVTCIIHHALLCQNADTSYTEDLNATMRSAVEEFVAADPCSFYQLLRATLPTVDAQLRELNSDEDGTPPLRVWDWKPQEREPSWIVHIVDFAFRSSAGFLEKLRPMCDEAQWALLLRYIELWSESLQEGEDASQEIRRMQLAAGANKEQTGVLTHTAQAVATNIVYLVQWLQQREHIALPVVVLPPSKPADQASASGSSSASSIPSTSTATSSLPLDAATNSILNTLGHVLLFRSWDRSLVFNSVRAGLALNNCATLLLNLLHAADVVDGGSMFSDLYRPAGHTRHTKKSQEPMDYVNQFDQTKKGEGEQKADTGATSSASSTAAAAAHARSLPPPLAARMTPYQLKSNILRLIASLSFHHPSFQSSFGADAVYTCMNHSVLDEHNPLMREYAILALRNLMEDHPGNQRVVEELRVEGIANQQELSEIGVQTTMDPNTGAIKIANMQPQPHQ
jgi:hypothetical protein